MRPRESMSPGGVSRTVIEPGRKSFPHELREVVEHRELLFFLAWRDVKVRYTQTALGASWAVLQPAAMVVVFSVFFGRFAKVDSGSLPYPAFALAGLVPWTFFANAVTGAANSLVQSANLISKVYFPRILVPIAAVLAWVPDLVVSSMVMLLGAAALGAPVTARVVILPLLVMGMIPVAVSVSVGLAGVNVAYRDVRYAIPFLIQIWLFVTPVIYPLQAVPGRFRWIAALNPMAGVVEGFRWSLGQDAPLPISVIAASSIACLFLAALSTAMFGHFKERLADVA